MRKLFTILAFIFISISVSAVDIEEYFSASSTGHYYPFQKNGTITLKFDFIVNQGPINQSFVIAFVLSTDMNVFDHNDILIDTVRVSGAPNGSSEFPTNFVSPAPYKIEQMLKKANVVHGTTYFLGCILDYNDDIAESNESNNSGPIQMPPLVVSGNVGFNTDLGFFKSSIYPNPITETAIINLSGKLKGNSTIQVYGTDGRLIRENNEVQFPYTFQRGNLAAGTYQMIIINNEKAILRKKIVIQ